jgi:hypothetical protein
VNVREVVAGGGENDTVRIVVVYTVHQALKDIHLLFIMDKLRELCCTEP